MMIICDTHVMIFWADAPERLSTTAQKVIKKGRKEQKLACADISLWEISMLASKGRIKPQEPVEQYINDIILAMGLNVLAINPEIATLSQSELFQHKDPADRLIAATALHYKAKLVSKDEKLTALDFLDVVW